ncbi:PepSY-associated TM helix domain-containing protein [Xylophilus sp. ASV27]|uniref:PepSY-associated TM helix domain-containing protein n=1 Tax=Xylophilus sp. ASV27 TaxID=2795129 RepID=UPI0018EAEEB2|nr:PepSY-associated TM helix domain-containing protein [Xylophilus sp. ASV27]
MKEPSHIRIRRIWRQVHLWIALTVGFVLALLGLSGSVLVLRAPLLQWEVGAAAVRLQNPSLIGTPFASQEAWKQSAQTAYPQLVRVMGTAAPRGGFLVSDNAMVFGPVQGRKGIGIAMVDPYTADPRAFFVFDDLWLAKAVALHRSLLLPPSVGAPLLAACGVALLISVCTGAWLWWPRGWQWSRWRAALTLHRRSRGLRFWMELHNVAAAYLFVPLLLLTLTGVWLARPGWFTWLDAVGLGRSFKPTASALHAELMLGVSGQVIAVVAGLVLPVLYVSGLVMWWRKRAARLASIPSPPSHPCPKV